MDFDRHNLQPEDAGGMVDGGMDDIYIDHLNSALDWSEREIARLKDENAKLREYVNAMAIQRYKGKMFDCGYCPFFNQCYNGEPKEHQGRGCQWWLWARELGVEVDG